MQKKDEVLRFLFNNHGVRGEIMHANASINKLFENHDYPLPVKRLLMDLSTCAILITSTLKANGEIMVQVQCDQDNQYLKYALININKDLKFYGSAHVKEGANFTGNESFKDLVGHSAALIISIFPENGQKYQGIVSLSNDTLAMCLEDYFASSEQLDTKILIFQNEKTNQTAGMLLQIIPEIENNHESLHHLYTLASTLTNEEVFNLPLTEILRLLFAHEETVVFEPQAIDFKCVCSKERCKNALLQLPKADLEDLLKDHGTTMTCQHCGKKYSFSEQELLDIYNYINQ